MSGSKRLAVVVRLSALFILVSITNLIPPKLWVQEVIQNLGAYFLLTHLFVFVLFIKLRPAFGRLFSLGLICQIVSISYYIALLWKFFFAVPQSTNLKAEEYKIFYANVYAANDRYSELNAMINREDPSIVGLLEITDEWSRALDLFEKYPFRLEILRPDCFGLGIYSKFPFTEGGPKDFGEELVPALATGISLPNQKTLKILLLHSRPPLSQKALYHNRILLRRVASTIRFDQEPTIVFGDFNATPFSVYLRRLIEWSDLQHAFWGKGLIRTWNAQNPLIRLELDHVLFKGELGIRDTQILEEFGSDHFPLLTTIQVY